MRYRAPLVARLSLVCIVFCSLGSWTVQAIQARTSHAATPKNTSVSTSTPAATIRKLNIEGRPVRGAPDAKVTIIVFEDFQCPFCAALHTTLGEMLKDYKGRVRLIYKDAPNTHIHNWAAHAAVNANCLAAQSNAAYWEFTDYVLSHQTEVTGSDRQQKEQFASLDQLAVRLGNRHGLELSLLQKCLEQQSISSLENSFRDAVQLGIRSVPTVLVNDQQFTGAVPAQVLREAIDRALQEQAHP